MLIDWFTVGAQALNFVILVWLMKRFLYKPILDAIDTREKRIAKALADATAKETEANKERDEFQRKNQEVDRQRAELLKKATDDAEAERQRLLDAAHKAADRLSAQRQETIRNDVHALYQAIGRRAQREVFAIARKALAELAGANLDERMSEVFTQRLRALNGEAKEGLVNALKTAPQPATVRSAFDLPPAQQKSIQDAVNVTCSAAIPLRFETAPDLVGGIEIATDGQKVSWSIAGYLASLEEGISGILQGQDKTASEVKSP